MTSTGHRHNMSNPTMTRQADYDRTRLNYDEWLGRRIDRALYAIRHAEQAGLETALELVGFAEDVLNHYEPRVLPTDCLHCGQVRERHSGDHEVCVKAGYYGNRYTPVVPPDGPGA